MSEETRSLRAGWAIFAILGALLLINGGAAVEDCQSLRPVHEGEEAPEFSAPRIKANGSLGREFSISETRGQVVVIDFWATWCGPCEASMPVLEGIATAYGDRGVRVISVNTEGPGAAQRARRMTDRLAPSVELLSDTGVASALYKVNTIPHMLIVDRAGTVRWVHRGLGSVGSLRRDLSQAIKALL
ncbi:MAG: TlpA family protein disulfide reductase [Myxococcales bacterium]|nr:TlpA family protein disulfide reductase [Myxococcales bacterium]